MMSILKRAAFALPLVALAFISSPRADLVVKDGNAATQTLFDFTCFTSKHCTAHVIINSAGTEVFTAGAPGYVQFPSAQSVNATVIGVVAAAVTNVGTFATQATQSGTWNINNISGTISLPTGAATAAAQTDASQKTQIVDGSGNVIASTSNNLNVQCANCSGSGVSTADAASFTAGASLFAGTGGFFQTTATNNPLTNGQQGMWQMTAQRAGFVNLRNASGAEVGVTGAELFVGGRGTAGSAAGGVLTIQGVASMTPVFVASSTAPVSTMNSASANTGINAALAGVFDDSAPTSITENNFGALRMSANRNLYGTIRDAAGNERGANVDASNRLTTAPTIVSGAVASGAFASGSVASGAFASGSVSSGAFASGSLAAGSMVDLLTVRGTKAPGTAAANSLLGGCIYTSAGVTLTDAQQAATQCDSTGATRVNVINSNANGQAAMAASSPVVIASNQSAIPVTLTSTTITGTAAVTQSGAWTVQPGNTQNTTPWLVRPNDGTNSQVLDPCQTVAKSRAVISITTATTTAVITGAASKKTHICHVFLMTVAANNVALVEDATGTTCVSPEAALIGGVTAANGMNFSANSGMSLGNGQSAIAATVTNQNDICLITSAATPLAGVITYVQQ